MDLVFWRLHDYQAVALAIIITLVVCFGFFNSHYVPVLIRTFYRRIVSGEDSYVPANLGDCPPGLIIIPSLLRNDEDYNAIVGTIESCATNGYTNDLFIVVSIDGKNENPALFAQISEWCNSRSYGSNIYLHLTYNEIRRSKMMAIERGSQYMQELIENGVYTSFPPVYFSIDADSILSDNALNRLASELNIKNWITGNKRRTVAGAPTVRADELWKGWKFYFTIQGQIYLNVARLFLLASVARNNLGMVPYIGVPGAIYITWSEILLEGPKFMGYIRSLTFGDWIKWWFGVPLPKLSDSTATPVPEAMTGNTDDTSVAVLISLSTWKNGKLSLELPASPIEAMVRLLRSWFIERTHHHDPEAKAYTFVPPTIRGLWLQRVRWNSSRWELASSRFLKAFIFGWDTSFPFVCQLMIVCLTFARVVITYVILPFMLFGQACNVLYYLLFGMAVSLLVNFLLTAFALVLDTERAKYWRILLALPTAGMFALIFGAGAGIYGVIKDIFFNGNNVRFTPEATLIASGSSRIALYYRIKRFISMCIRSIKHGDVGFGTWWWGWHAHEPFVKSGYHGWSAGKKAKYVLK